MKMSRWGGMYSNRGKSGGADDLVWDFSSAEAELLAYHKELDHLIFGRVTSIFLYLYERKTCSCVAQIQSVFYFK